MENAGLDKNSIIKKSFLYVVFVVEIIFLFTAVEGFVKNQRYFSLSPDFAIPFALISLLTLWTIGVFSQTLNKKWEILIAPAILFISSFVFLSKFKIIEALLGATLISLYLLYSIQRTKDLSESLVKVKIRYSGKNVAKGFLLAVSALTALSVYLTSANVSSLDIGKWAADMMEKPLKDAVEKEYEKETPEEIKSLNLNSLKESSPQIVAVLNSFGINEMPANIALPESTTESITGTIKNSISSQVNKAIEPYKKFLNPTLALLVFGLLQIYNSVIYFIYSNTISIFVAFLKKTGFLKIKTVTVEKEILNI